MTQLFVTRAELMASGETTDEHRASQEEESGIVERDRQNTDFRNGGLFRGCFKDRTREGTIRDYEDGVERCPQCTWELEDGYCNRCRVIFGSDEGGDFSVDGVDWSDEDISDEDISHDDFEEEVDENSDGDLPDFIDDGEGNSLDGDNHDDARSMYSDYGGEYYGPVDHYSPTPMPGEEDDNLQHATDGYESTASGGGGTTDLNNGYDSNEDEEGDQSARISLYGDSETTARVGLNYLSDVDDEDPLAHLEYRFSSAESSNEDANSQTSSRGRSAASRTLEDAETITSRSRSPSQGLFVAAQRYTGTARSNGKQREQAAASSSQAPVYNVDSDSEPPIPSQRSRKRRLVVEDDSSQDHGDSDAGNYRPRKRKSSSGSATIGPNSPQAHNSTHRSDRTSGNSTPERESSVSVPQPFLSSITSRRPSSNRLGSNIGPSTGRRGMSNRLLEPPPRNDCERFGGGGGGALGDYGESSSHAHLRTNNTNHLFSRSMPRAQDFFEL